MLKYSLGNEVVYVLNAMQVASEPQSVSPDAQPDEQSQGEDNTENHVEAFVVEGTCMCTRVDCRVLVDVHEDNIVPAVV